jgi:hypothetical protein
MNMKKILFSILTCCGLFILSSCEKKVTTEDTSVVTHYISFELEGEESVLVPLNGTYAEPGFTAIENGNDVKSKVSITITDAAGKVVSSIPTDAPGFYTVTYAGTNIDGFDASATRYVFVYDPALTVSLEGTYTTDMSASLYGTQGKTYADYAPNYGYTGTPTVTFEEIAPGFYDCSDLLGGWYAQVRGIGSRANMTGMVALNSDNTITLLSSYIAYWGDALDYINSSSFDPATGKLTYFASYAGQIFVTPVLYKN